MEQAQEILKLDMALTDDAFVVVQADGAPLQPPTITRQWHLLFWKHKVLLRICFHDLRHAHATHMLSSGGHRKVASESASATRRSESMGLIRTLCRECRKTPRLALTAI